ncbi:hypothetical protein NDU88_006048 [Pleurodeles waltl]|uniref:Uncharacterized protein n=1 Tax=Pleurodeles waltl TaxID=8319 RepID=A0AAV7X320_PLEWA|nr:hypothetical protein NDU88_006048 [Pleurodeles waltl]
MDSSGSADSDPAATEQQREGHAGSQMPEETTTRRLPDARWDEQEEAKSTDWPPSRKSVVEVQGLVMLPFTVLSDWWGEDTLRALHFDVTGFGALLLAATFGRFEWQWRLFRKFRKSERRGDYCFESLLWSDSKNPAKQRRGLRSRIELK